MIKFPGVKAEKFIYGTGVATYDPFAGTGPDDDAFAAGSTVGPEIGDQGDWGQKKLDDVDLQRAPMCRDIYVNGVYDCTICDQGAVVLR